MLRALHLCGRLQGEGNATKHRRPLHRDVALAAAAAYAGAFEESGSIPATYQIVFMTGWAPAPGQQMPKRRGSATVRLEDLATQLQQQAGTGTKIKAAFRSGVS